ALPISQTARSGGANYRRKLHERSARYCATAPANSPRWIARSLSELRLSEIYRWPFYLPRCAGLLRPGGARNGRRRRAVDRRLLRDNPAHYRGDFEGDRRDETSEIEDRSHRYDRAGAGKKSRSCR